MKCREVVAGQVGQVGWLGDDILVEFGQKFLGEKLTVRQCTVLMQQPVVLLPSKFAAKSSYIFNQPL
jgi:hypothetical protein